MPFFTLPILPDGPLVKAYVQVSVARREALVAAGVPVPAPQKVSALVDTGASCTCVDPSILTALALTPTGIATVITPSTGNQPHTTEQFDVAIIIPGAIVGHVPLVIPNLPVISSQLAVQGFHALIGRDILSNCIMHYNGVSKIFTLAY